MRKEQTIVALGLEKNCIQASSERMEHRFSSIPWRVCSALISYGLEDDVILAAALLHDILEDCREQLKKIFNCSGLAAADKI